MGLKKLVICITPGSDFLYGRGTELLLRARANVALLKPDHEVFGPEPRGHGIFSHDSKVTRGAPIPLQLFVTKLA